MPLLRFVAAILLSNTLCVPCTWGQGVGNSASPANAARDVSERETDASEGETDASEGETDASDLVDDQIDVSPQDWPWWRGPNRNGVAAAHQNPPLEWDEDTNVAWKTPIPGRGHGSPIVCGDRVLLLSAIESTQRQVLLCLDRDSGKLVWEKDIHAGGLPPKLNKKATHASSTPAWDGEHFFVSLVSHGAAFATSLDRDGKIRWQKKLTDYVVHQGYGASPCVYQNLVIVGGDNKQAGMLTALDRKSGTIMWQRKRPTKPNYPSPVVLNVYGKDQLLMTGTDLVTSLHPLTGKTLWEIDGATTECVTSTVTDGELIFTSGGYPDNHMSAVRADGSGEVVWRNRNRVYVPSMIVHDGYLFAVLDAGIAACWESGTGKEVWKSRLGGTFSSSPTLVGDRIYVTNEAGETFVFRCRPTNLNCWQKTNWETMCSPRLLSATIAFTRALLSTAMVSARRCSIASLVQNNADTANC